MHVAIEDQEQGTRQIMCVEQAARHAMLIKFDGTPIDALCAILKGLGGRHLIAIAHDETEVVTLSDLGFKHSAAVVMEIDL